MAVADSSKRGFFSSSKPGMKNRSSVFAVGNRDLVLTQDIEAPVIVPHVSQKNETKVLYTSMLFDTSDLYVQQFWIKS